MKHYTALDLHGRGHEININITSAQSKWDHLLDLDTLKLTYVSAAGDITD